MTLSLTNNIYINFRVDLLLVKYVAILLFRFDVPIRILTLEVEYVCVNIINDFISK